MSQHKHLDRTKRVAVSYIYNPENQSRDELIDGFVIRVRQFKKILRSITSTELDAPPQHFLIEGQRGAGKTSLMLRLRYELDGTPSDHILPLQLPEEQYGIFNLCALWEHVADELEEVSGFSGIVEAFDRHAHDQQYDIDCFDLLDRYLENNAKRLVLFLDNFGDLLDRLSEIEHKRLRDIFHTSKRIQLIAGSARTLEQTYKYDQPFYEFFKIERLESLSNVETISLLKSLAKQHNAVSEINEIALEEPEKIESLRLLSGGVPRTIVFLFEVLLDQNGDVFDDLEALLDRVTPLYKNRMDDLPRQQQAIVNIIALAWDGVSNKDIVDALKSKEFDSRKVASQLSQLEASDTVFSKKVDKKNKIYFIKERFFNIWYLMRLARKRDKARVKWLVSFLQVLYSTEQIEHRGWAHIKNIRDGGVSHKAVERWTPVLADASLNKELQEQLISTRDQYLQSIGESENGLPDTKFQALANEVLEGAFQTLSELREGLKKQGVISDPEVHYFQGLYHRYKTEYEQAEQSFVESLQAGFRYALIGLGNLYRDDLGNYDKALEFYQQAVEQGETDALINLGYLYSKYLKDYDNAIGFYQQAVEQGYTDALVYLGYLYRENLKDYDKAVEFYQQAIEQGHTRALLNLGNVYCQDLKDYDKAIEIYQQAIEQGDTRALLNLGNVYCQDLKDYDKAIEFYQQAIEQGVTGALLKLGYMYHENLKNYDKAIEVYQQAVEQGDRRALVTLGILYHRDLKDYDKAIETYQQAVEHGDTRLLLDLGTMYRDKIKDYDKAVEFYQQATEQGDTRALLSLGNLYSKNLKDYDKAIEFYQQAIEQGDTRALLNLGNLYCDNLKDYDKAIEVYQQAIDQGDTGALLNLGYLYSKNLKDYDKAIEFYQQAIEQGDTRALLNLGNLYCDNLKDYDKAIEVYQQAVDQGVKGALLNLGNLYCDNLKDYDKAIEVYQQAIDQGDTGALLNLGYLYHYDLKDYDKAIETYQQAIEQGDTGALLNLGYVYRHDLKDCDKAIEVYQQAVEQDLADAFNTLSWLYFEENRVDKKPEALALSARFMSALFEEVTVEELDTRASILLWCDGFDEAYEIAKQIFSKPDYRKIIVSTMDFFIFLLAKNQRHMALNLFEQFTSLKDEIKPVYYALMHLLKDEFPKEHIKMGSELEEPVAKVLEKIRSVQKRYEIS